MGIAENIARVREAIADAERSAGRAPGSVRLMAVSKFHPEAAVLEAIAAGQTLFGENRVQEAESKFSAVFAACPAAELHLIGSLQRNKVRQILPLVACIQSVDREELLVEIGKRTAATGKTVTVLFEFHTGEESKSGYADTDSLFRSIDLLQDMPLVRSAGFMTMAPLTDDERAIRSSFRRLVSVRDECAARWPGLDFGTLSMGMSSDYRIAIEEGSTLVRIGTAIFGARA